MVCVCALSMEGRAPGGGRKGKSDLLYRSPGGGREFTDLETGGGRSAGCAGKACLSEILRKEKGSITEVERAVKFPDARTQEKEDKDGETCVV